MQEGMMMIEEIIMDLNGHKDLDIVSYIIYSGDKE